MEKPGTWTGEENGWDRAPVVTIARFIDEEMAGHEARNDWKVDNILFEGVKVVREQQRPDGIAFTAIDGNREIRVITYRQFGTRWLRCVASQHDPDGVAAFDKARTMLETICESVRRDTAQ